MPGGLQQPAQEANDSALGVPGLFNVGRFIETIRGVLPAPCGFRPAATVRRAAFVIDGVLRHGKRPELSRLENPFCCVMDWGYRWFDTDRARMGDGRVRRPFNRTSGRSGKIARMTAGACTNANLCDNLTVGNPIADGQWLCVSAALIGTRGFDTFSTPAVACEKEFCSPAGCELTRFSADLAWLHRRARKSRRWSSRRFDSSASVDRI
jgi:hypothetical protein